MGENALNFIFPLAKPGKSSYASDSLEWRLSLAPNSPEDLVVVASFTTSAEAQLARNLLTLRGIPSTIAGAALVDIAWHLSNATGGVRLQVRACDAEASVEALAAADSETRPEAPVALADAEAEAEPTGSKADALVRHAMAAAVFGLFLLPGIAHAYSVILLMQSGETTDPLSPRARRWRAVAILFDLLGFALAMVVLAFLMAGCNNPYQSPHALFSYCKGVDPALRQEQCASTRSRQLEQVLMRTLQRAKDRCTWRGAELAKNPPNSSASAQEALSYSLMPFKQRSHS